MTDSASADLRERLARYMRANKLKNTRQREVIFETFLGATGHLSLEELLSAVQLRMAGVGYATVYRTMKLLTEAGVALEHRFGDGQVRYEISYNESDHHDHLICVDCGYIFEFENDTIERLQTAVALEYGLVIAAHRHDIWGRCTSFDTCEHRRAQEQRAR